MVHHGRRTRQVAIAGSGIVGRARDGGEVPLRHQRLLVLGTVFAGRQTGLRGVVVLQVGPPFRRRVRVVRIEGDGTGQHEIDDRGDAGAGAGQIPRQGEAGLGDLPGTDDVASAGGDHAAGARAARAAGVEASRARAAARAAGTARGAAAPPATVRCGLAPAPTAGSHKNEPQQHPHRPSPSHDEIVTSLGALSNRYRSRA